jgi:ribosomal protein S18 acetylase RimI-like enzyme
MPDSASSITLATNDAYDLTTAATIHVTSLATTINSHRGRDVISRIYALLVTHGHEIYLARLADRIVGGIVIQVHGQPSPSVSALLARPTSWLTALHALGLREVSAQVIDFVKLKTAASKIAPHDYILALYVDQPHRKHGIARQLIDAAIRSSGSRRNPIVVDTNLSNLGARSLYEKAGFSEQHRTSRSVLLKHPVG